MRVYLYGKVALIFIFHNYGAGEYYHFFIVKPVKITVIAFPKFRNVKLRARANNAPERRARCGGIKGYFAYVAVILLCVVNKGRKHGFGVTHYFVRFIRLIIKNAAHCRIIFYFINNIFTVFNCLVKSGRHSAEIVVYIGKL